MPTTWKQHEQSLSEPGLCDLLPIRDYLDDVMIRMSGEFVAGYVLKGAVSYFADDAGLNTIKSHLEAILRTIPEESMRLQFRFEVTEDLGDLLQRYQDCSRTQDEATLAMDQNRLAIWQRKEAGGEYLRRITHLYLIWDSERHHRVLAGSGKTAKRNKDGGGFSLATRKIVQHTLKEHIDLMSEFESLLNGIESAMVAAGLDPQRMSDQDLFLETKLLKIQRDIIASSLKAVKVSLTIGVRTSKAAHTTAEYEEAEREIASRKQQILHIISRMNGASGLTEDIAQRRIFLSSLPGLAGEDKREIDLLSCHAADLLPLEMPWTGTPRSPLMLIETPYRQLIPFSPFDPDLSDANMLVAAASGHGKSMMTGQMLLQAARQDTRVSIIERGDSYRNLVEYMGGQMITMALDSEQTLNPWDLESGEREPSREQVAFLKGLTRHMLGDIEASDLLDNVLVDAIERTYRRAAMRPGNTIPTFGDLRDELQYYQDADRNERVMEEARLAAFKLRNWVSPGGVYENLFDRQTTLKLDSPWIYLNVEKLKDDPRLESAMSLLIAWATTKRTSGKSSHKLS